MKIDVAMKNYSNIQTLFKLKLKHEFRIMIINIKLYIQNQGFFSQLYRLGQKIKIIFKLNDLEEMVLTQWI